MNKSSIENPIEILASIITQHNGDTILNNLNEKFIDILTYRVSGDIDKLVSLAKRRAEFLLNCRDIVKPDTP